MKDIVIKFTPVRHAGDPYFKSTKPIDGNCAFVCRRYLAGLFELPENSKADIYITLSDKETKDSYCCKIPVHQCDIDIHYEHSFHRIVLDGSADWALSHFGLNDKRFYVSVSF